MELRCRGRVLSLDRMALMGVLNVTPDSFSNGGRWLDADAAIGHAFEMIAAGADIVDVGGESTRPGAEPVPAGEEMARVLPVVDALHEASDVLISIDTRKSVVAEAAIEAGASIVNDTLGEDEDLRIAEVAGASGAAVVAMHSRGTPQTMTSLTAYGDLVGEVRAWLEAKAKRLVWAGVAQDAIVLDPGFGFAKSVSQNLVLLNRLGELTGLGYPVLVGTSRKSFIGKVLDVDESHRVEGTAATVVWALLQGARLARVHDVLEVGRAVRMTEAIAAAAAEGSDD